MMPADTMPRDTTGSSMEPHDVDRRLRLHEEQRLSPLFVDARNAEHHALLSCMLER